jgi:hypothetical protein
MPTMTLIFESAQGVVAQEQKENTEIERKKIK